MNVLGVAEYVDLQAPAFGIAWMPLLIRLYNARRTRSGSIWAVRASGAMFTTICTSFAARSM
ncbi:MAG: hypothetical protein M5R36_01765 [Deltaproteobacteria bacterium]|nr:hypothetical protein [Deltaproteobacteria bacterium]